MANATLAKGALVEFVRLLQAKDYTADGAIDLRPHIAKLDATSATVQTTLAAPGAANKDRILVIEAVDVSNTCDVDFTGPGGATTITFTSAGQKLILYGISATAWAPLLAMGFGALTQTYSTADATHAARAASAITDNGGGAAADGTIAVVTAPTALTDSSGGSASATLAAITNAANAGSADVGPVADAIASLAARQAENRAAIVALTDAVKELSTGINNVRTDQVDTAQFANSIADLLQKAGLAT